MFRLAAAPSFGVHESELWIRKSKAMKSRLGDGVIDRRPIRVRWQRRRQRRVESIRLIELRRGQRVVEQVLDFAVAEHGPLLAELTLEPFDLLVDRIATRAQLLEDRELAVFPAKFSRREVEKHRRVHKQPPVAQFAFELRPLLALGF